MAGTDFERLNTITDAELRMYIRAHGFQVTEELQALVEKEGPQIVLSEMKSIVNDIEENLGQAGDIPLLVIIQETRSVDYAAAISNRLRDSREEKSK